EQSGGRPLLFLRMWVGVLGWKPVGRLERMVGFLAPSYLAGATGTHENSRRFLGEVTHHVINSSPALALARFTPEAYCGHRKRRPAGRLGGRYRRAEHQPTRPVALATDRAGRHDAEQCGALRPTCGRPRA